MGQHHTDIYMKGTAQRSGDLYMAISLQGHVQCYTLHFEHVQRWEVKEGKGTRIGYDAWRRG